MKPLVRILKYDGKKKINRTNLSKTKRLFLSKIVPVQDFLPQVVPTLNPVSLSDFTHDFENQLVKIQQKIEHLGKKISYIPNRKVIEHYEEVVSKHPKEVADAMISIDRIVHHMFCEIACLTILEGDSEKIEQYQVKNKHVVHKIILRIIRIYSEELARKRIRPVIHQSEIEWEINEDIFSAIVLKIVENCTKYCKMGSTLEIFIEENAVIFAMESLKIEGFERMKIFDENVSGRHSGCLPVSSTGKGLFHAKKLADFHGFGLDIYPGRDSEDVGGVPYSHNKFYIKK